jgi:hypothetical protein
MRAAGRCAYPQILHGEVICIRDGYGHWVVDPMQMASFLHRIGTALQQLT